MRVACGVWRVRDRTVDELGDGASAGGGGAERHSKQQQRRDERRVDGKVAQPARRLAPCRHQPHQRHRHQQAAHHGRPPETEAQAPADVRGHVEALDGEV